MGLSVVVIVVILYFIRDQFEFSEVKRFTYLSIPLFSMFQFFNQMTWTLKNSIIFILIALFSVWIGIFQAKYSKVRVEKIPVSYYVDSTGQEKINYKKVIKVKGGKAYLIGWLSIFTIQLLVQFLISKKMIETSTLIPEIMNDIIEDLFAPYRLFDIEKNKHTWYVWVLYGTSSLSYAISLSYMSPQIKAKLLSNKEKYEYEMDKE